MSKPCEKCTKFINKYNIRKIYYSTNYDYDCNYLNIQTH
jgi:deoxycytidylate deaminase